MCVRAQVLTICDTMDCSLPGCSVRGIFQARILEQVAISHSRGSAPPRQGSNPGSSREFARRWLVLGLSNSDKDGVGP